MQADYVQDRDGVWRLSDKSEKKINGILEGATNELQKLHSYLQEVTVHSGLHSAAEKKAMRKEILNMGISERQLSSWEKEAEAGYQAGVKYGNSPAALGEAGQTAPSEGYQGKRKK